MNSDIYQLIKKSKTDFVQVNFADAVTKRISFEKQEVKDFSKTSAESVSVSVWIGKKQGVVTSTKFSKELLDRAIRVAKSSEDLEFFYGIPSIKKASKGRKLYFGEKSEDEIFDSAKCLIPLLKKNESVSKAEIEYSTFTRKIINSEGTDLEEKGSLFGASVEDLIKDKEPITYIDTLSSRDFPSKKEISKFSNAVINETRELRHPLKLKKIPKDIILSYDALSKLIQSGFISNFNGMNVLKKRSCLGDSQGRKLFSEKFNLIDSGVLERGVESQCFDDEGSPSRENVLIKKGVVGDFIYDYNTAKHLGKTSTGNSLGGGIGFNNLIIKKGKGINLDNCLIVKDILGAHTCNETTTEFSVKSFGTLLVENGKKMAVKDVMIQGRVLNILKKIVAVGNKVKNVGGYYVPEIAFNGIHVESM